MSNPNPPRPKGFLVAVGGNEDKEFAKTVLRSIAELPDGGTRVVEIIPTASSMPKELGQAYVEAFGKLGIRETRVMDIQSRADARDATLVKRIKECDIVFFTGGDQLRITSLLGGSPVLNAIKGHYWNGGVVAGTSAGAAAMSGTMIFEGEASAAMHKGTVHMTPGLGLIRSAVIDTHFINRGRLSRLLEVVTSNPGYIGLGVGEDTGIIIRDGHVVDVIGQGLVVVVDGHQLGHTNISEIELAKPIAVEHILVHTLVAGYCYDLDEQRYIPSTDPPKKKVQEHANS